MTAFLIKHIFSFHNFLDYPESYQDTIYLFLKLRNMQNLKVVMYQNLTTDMWNYS